MKILWYVNFLYCLLLGSIIVGSNLPPTINSHINSNIDNIYQNICLISPKDYGTQIKGSGVLLQSGTILTASHIVDRNYDGIISNNEQLYNVTFPFINKTFEVKAIISSTDLDIAVLKPTSTIPLHGVQLMDDDMYWNIKIGDKLYSIGMQNGLFPANITDGRMIEMNRHNIKHRNSANSYFGSSGGGVFIGDKLIGISSAVGVSYQIASAPIRIPDGIEIGMISMRYRIPLANISLHVPAPQIRKFLLDNQLDYVLKINDNNYDDYIKLCSKYKYAILYYIFMIFILLGSLKCSNNFTYHKVSLILLLIAHQISLLVVHQFGVLVIPHA